MKLPDRNDSGFLFRINHQVVSMSGVSAYSLKPLNGMISVGVPGVVGLNVLITPAESTRLKPSDYEKLFSKAIEWFFQLSTFETLPEYIFRQPALRKRRSKLLADLEKTRLAKLAEMGTSDDPSIRNPGPGQEGDGDPVDGDGDRPPDSGETLPDQSTSPSDVGN